MFVFFFFGLSRTGVQGLAHEMFDLVSDQLYRGWGGLCHF